MWFLWSILGLSLGTAFVHFVFNDNILVYVIGLVLSPFLPYLGSRIWLYPFFVGAYLFAKHKNRFSKIVDVIKKPYSIAAFIILHFVLVLFWKNDYYIYVPTGLGFTIYGQENYLRYFIALFYRGFAGIIGSIAVILTINAIVEYIKPKKINKIIGALSRYSLGIYVFSFYILCGIIKYVSDEIISMLNLENGFNMLMVLSAALSQTAISLIAMIVIDRFDFTRKLLLGGR